MSTYSFAPSNKSPAFTLADPSSQSVTLLSIPIPNPEYFNVAINNITEPLHNLPGNLFKEMHTNLSLQPPPLSLHTTLATIKGSIDNIGFSMVANIAKGLAATIDKHNKDHYVKQLAMQDQI